MYGLEQPVTRGLPQVGAQRCHHGGDKLAQDAVFIQTGDLAQSGLNLVFQVLLLQRLRSLPNAGSNRVMKG
jgi:hypothetical protein